MMDYQSIDYQIDGGVAVIRLNRPDQLNAYTPDMGDELVDAYRCAAKDSTLHAVIVTGNGRGFCAGADREYLSGKRGIYGKQLGEEEFVDRFSIELANHPKLTIAAMNGSAAGIGVTAFLGVDLRVMSPGKRLVLNFAELGLIPGMGASYFLPRLIGVSHSKDLLICQREINAEQALDIGLVDYLDDDVLAKAYALAQAARGCKPGTIAAIKNALSVGAGSSLVEAVDNEWALATSLRNNVSTK